MSINKDYKIVDIKKKYFFIKYKKKIIKFSKPTLIGNHQVENASSAIVSILKLNELGYKFSKTKINKGIYKTKWPGRLEVGNLNNIKVYLDGAHNLEGAKQILKYFKEILILKIHT